MVKLETATVIWQSVWVFSSFILLSVSLLFLFFSIFSLGTDCALSFSKGPWILLFFPSLSLFLLFSYGNFHWCFFSSQILSFLTLLNMPFRPSMEFFITMIFNSNTKIIFYNSCFLCVLTVPTCPVSIYTTYVMIILYAHSYNKALTLCLLCVFRFCFQIWCDFTLN